MANEKGATQSVRLERRHEWDALREFPTTLDTIERGQHRYHESVMRSYQVLRQVAEMLERGDSPETVLSLIRWTDGGYTSDWRLP